MRFFCVYKPSQAPTGPPSPEAMAEMGKFAGGLTKSGILLATGGWLSGDKGARITLSGGEFKVTDGPFAESKELVGGFALMQVGSRNEAVEITKRFLQLAGDGESELRPITEGMGG